MQRRNRRRIFDGRASGWNRRSRRSRSQQSFASARDPTSRLTEGNGSSRDAAVSLASLTVPYPDASLWRRLDEESHVNSNQARNQSPQPEVHIRVEADADASRITAVLEALGYQVLRQLDEGEGPARLEWAVERLCLRHKLTSRERDVLIGVLEGNDNAGLAKRLEISRATVKWHLHNVFAKVGVTSREDLLRAALQLGPREESRPSEDPYWAGPHDVTAKIE
jgi:DNA-binding CsgD family transcriptional regulator